MSGMSPAWVVEGGPVVVAGSGGLGRVEKRTIARLTATLVILDNGARFSRKTLQRKVTDWRYENLRSADDTFAQLALKKQAVADAVGGVGRAAEEFVRQAGGEENAQRIEDFIARYRKVASA